MKNLLYLSFVFYFVCDCIYAQSNLISVSETNTFLDLSYLGGVYEDTSDSLRFEDIQSKEFKTLDHFLSTVRSAKHTSAVWFKWTITNQTHRSLFLIKDFTFIHFLELYYKDSLGVHKKRINEYQNKDNHSVDHPLAVFELDAAKNDTITYFLKVKTDYLLSPIFFLADEIQIQSYLQKRSASTGVYVGFVLILVLFNFFLLGRISGTFYSSYIAYTLSILLFVMSESGYASYYIWPNFSLLRMHVPILFSSSALVFSIIFIHAFLNLNNSKKYRLIKAIVIILAIIPSLLSLFINVHSGFVFVIFSLAIGSSYLFGVVFLSFKRGFKPAKYLFWGWTTLSVAVVFNVLRHLNIIPSNLIVGQAIMIGSSIEFFLLSIALMDRVKHYQKMEKMSKTRYGHALEEQNEKLEEIIKERTESLRRVMAQQDTIIKARTNDLSQMNRELSQKMENIFMFSNMASQSLRRPVTNLLGANMLVTDMDASDEETDFWISVVKQSSEYLDYISHLLSYSIEPENDTNRLTRTINIGSLIQTLDSEIGGVITKVHGKYESYESSHFHLFVKFIELIVYKLAVMKYATSTREIQLNESGNYFEVLCKGDDVGKVELRKIENDQLDLDRYVFESLANTLNVHIEFINYGPTELSLKVSL